MLMVVEYDTEADATYVQLPGYDESSVDRVVEVERGFVTVDVDASGAPLGIEFLCAPANVSDGVFVALRERFGASVDMDDLQLALSGRSLAHS